MDSDNSWENGGWWKNMQIKLLESQLWRLNLSNLTASPRIARIRVPSCLTSIKNWIHIQEYYGDCYHDLKDCGYEFEVNKRTYSLTNLSHICHLYVWFFFFLPWCFYLCFCQTSAYSMGKVSKTVVKTNVKTVKKLNILFRVRS